MHKELPRSMEIDRIEMTKYESMKRKLTFRENVYHSHSKMRAGIFAYRFLAPLPDIPVSAFPKQQRLQLCIMSCVNHVGIPNTIVYDGESAPFWVFTKEGCVYRIDNFTNTQAVNRLGSVNKYELVAVLKTVLPCHDALSSKSTTHRRGSW